MKKNYHNRQHLELIGKQQLEIEHLKIRLRWANEDKQKITSALICIGGPLNDNKLGYSVPQRNYLLQILELAEVCDRGEL
jgi:hypothetical protein